MLDPIEIDPDGDVRCLVAHVAAIADLDDDRVEIEHRIERLERALLPGQYLVGDGVDDLGDRLIAELGADRRHQMMLNITHRHPARVERLFHRVEPIDTPLTLGHEHLRVRAMTVTRDRQLDVADLAGDGLRERAVREF